HFSNGQWSKAQLPAEIANANPQFLSVWGSGANDVWTAGVGGFMAHWDGGSWSRQMSGTDRSISGIWGTGPNDIWAVGHIAPMGVYKDGVILRWNGSAWSVMSTLPVGLIRIQGSSPG